MKIYRGRRIDNLDLDGGKILMGVTVTVEEDGKSYALDPRLDISRHSPTGFEWGYGGSGPCQLALALVADCVGDAYATAPIYQDVKFAIVANFPVEGWTLHEEELRMFIEEKIGLLNNAQSIELAERLDAQYRGTMTTDTHD